MKLFERFRATESADHGRLTSAMPGRHWATTGCALALGAALLWSAPLVNRVSAQAGLASGISRDVKHADRDAKRAERAAARDAKKKERAAARAHKSGDDDRSFAKAKPSKTSGGKSESHGGVDLGDNDPLQGL